MLFLHLISQRCSVGVLGVCIVIIEVFMTADNSVRMYVYTSMSCSHDVHNPDHFQPLYCV